MTEFDANITNMHKTLLGDNSKLKCYKWAWFKYIVLLKFECTHVSYKSSPILN